MPTLGATPAGAQWMAATGDRDGAFRVLDALAAARNLPPGLSFDPLFEELRKDPRWLAFAKRVGS